MDNRGQESIYNVRYCATNYHKGSETKSFPNVSTDMGVKLTFKLCNKDIKSLSKRSFAFLGFFIGLTLQRFEELFINFTNAFGLVDCPTGLNSSSS